MATTTLHTYRVTYCNDLDGNTYTLLDGLTLTEARTLSRNMKAEGMRILEIRRDDEENTL